MIIPRKTVVIPRKTQVIPGITQQKQGFLLQKRQHRQGEAKKYRFAIQVHRSGISYRKKSVYSENKPNKAEGERSAPPELISRKQEDHRHRTEPPQHTNNFENETFGIKRVFATEKRGGDVRAERARLFDPPPHDQSRHPQRHTVEDYNHIHRLTVFLSTLSGFDRIKAEQREVTPHYQSRYCQRHTVQGHYFFTLSQVTRECSIKNFISGNVCV